jgi:tetratricopeptide (TPR) repeat protein
MPIPRPPTKMTSALARPLALAFTLLALHAAPAQAVDPLREQARAMVDRGEHAPAIELFRQLVARYPHDSDLLIEAARVEGFADRNTQAAELYEQALRVAPERRRDILPSLAWQSLWAGRFERAAELFHARMADWSTAEEVADSRRGLAETLRGHARARLDAGDAEGALALYTQLESVERPDADALAERARVQGRVDRNAQSAATYRRAIELAPERRNEWLLALAWQTLWSDDPAGARALFSEAQAAGIGLPETWRGVAQSCAALERHPCAAEAWRKLLDALPDDRNARRGLARALLWSDRLDEAQAEYGTLLAGDPADAEARLGLAQAKNFSGRHREAVREFDRVDVAADEGRRVAKARALYWAGYADEAMPLLDDLADPEAQWLRDWRIRRDVQHYASAGIDWSDDADRLTVLTPWALAGWRRSPGDTIEVGLRLPRVSGYPINDASAPRQTINGREISATWGLRIGDVRSESGTLWPSVTIGQRDYGGWNSTAARVRLRYVPADRWRFEAEAGNGIIDTVSALRNHVDYRDASIGADFRPTPRWHFATGLARLRFDDANVRHRVSWQADYALVTRPRVLVGLEGNRFDDSRPWNAARENRGYYNPERYLENRLFTSLYAEQRPWSYYVKAALGHYSETDGFGNDASGRNYLLEGWVAYDLGPGWQLRAAAGMSDSEAGSPGGGSGYWRRFGSFSINAWF